MTTTACVPFIDGPEHLAAELRWLNLLLLREVVRFRAARQAPPDGFQGLYIGDAEVDRLLAESLGWSVNASDQAQLLEEIARQAATQREAIDERLAATTACGRSLPLARLATLFDLPAFDRAALLVACAPDLDGRYETLYAYLQDDVTRRRPAIGLTLSLLTADQRGQWQARARFAPAAPLAAHGLVRTADELPFRSRTLRVDDRVLDTLLDLPPAVDVRLRPYAEVLPAAGEDVTAQRDDLRALAALWRDDRHRHRPVALFEGGYGAGAEAAAVTVAGILGRMVIAVDVARLLAAPLAAGDAIDLLRRDALLCDGLLLLRDGDLVGGEEPRAAELRQALEPLLRRPPVPIVAACASPLDTNRLSAGIHLLHIPFPPSGYEERPALWRTALAAERLSAAGEDADRVAAMFVLSPGQIADAAAGAAHRVALRGGTRATLDDLRAAARAQSHHGLASLGRRIEPRAAWDDIVLPVATTTQLREIAAAVQHRHRVFSEWRFAGRFSRGTGLTVLLSGPSGTGKTLAAEVIARELGLDLYVIDLATVVSKYVGDTEKNLSRIFREAQNSNAVLFFDEADALFGKRSEVKDAHDRYANIEIAYLLQLMEAYEGIAILATNLSKNVDDAFTRRMQYVVEFPVPDEGLRARIWRVIFPAEAPLAEDVDFAFLARQFNLAGGNIKSAALTAAVLAAADGGQVTMPHLALAIAREYQKLGRLPSQGEFGPYYGDVLAHLSGRR